MEILVITVMILIVKMKATRVPNVVTESETEEEWTKSETDKE